MPEFSISDTVYAAAAGGAAPAADHADVNRG
jgi:hypothetical protein